MSLKSISNWLRFIIVFGGLCCFAVQSAGTLLFLVSEAEEIKAIATPWIVFIWSTAVPMLVALIYAWKTAGNIGKNNSFCKENTVNLHRIAICAGIDSVVVLVSNILLLAFNKSHPSVALVSLLIVAVGIACLVAAECLSQLIRRATRLQAESDLTI